MNAKDFRRDDGGNWKAIENIDKGLPCLNVATPLALVVEPVY
jgi:hypothetical protein